ncbi:hypothetical protein J6590_037659 [Homalodisca vitripennis]|nr:hypothetical protein J6590_037659 [Homalodisca vitripennis]
MFPHVRKGKEGVLRTEYPLRDLDVDLKDDQTPLFSGPIYKIPSTGAESVRAFSMYSGLGAWGSLIMTPHMGTPDLRFVTSAEVKLKLVEAIVSINLNGTKF